MNIWQICSELGFKDQGLGSEFFAGVFCTGKFDGVFDYNAGLLYVSVRKDFSPCYR